MNAKKVRKFGNRKLKIERNCDFFYKYYVINASISRSFVYVKIARNSSKWAAIFSVHLVYCSV